MPSPKPDLAVARRAIDAESAGDAVQRSLPCSAICSEGARPGAALFAFLQNGHRRARRHGDRAFDRGRVARCRPKNEFSRWALYFGCESMS